MDWPADQLPLKVQAETGTRLTETGELDWLSGAEWRRKRFCCYDAIRHRLGRISDAEWSESQRRCTAIEPPQGGPRPTPGQGCEPEP